MGAIKKFIEEKWRGIIILLLGALVLLLFYVFISDFQNKKEKVPEMELIEGLLAEETEENDKEEDTLEEEVLEIVVDVKGAVHSPGVYQMNPGDRVIDSIEMAGGFLADAEQKAVNLAQILDDQMVIYVPKIDEIPNDFTFETQLPTGENERGDKININHADKEELKTLNGIGDSKAEGIISYREENGPFKKIEDIKNVSGIGEATFEKLENEVEVTP